VDEQNNDLSSKLGHLVQHGQLSFLPLSIEEKSRKVGHLPMASTLLGCEIPGERAVLYIDFFNSLVLARSQSVFVRLVNRLTFHQIFCRFIHYKSSTAFISGERSCSAFGDP
jgi:hypothetical protein